VRDGQNPGDDDGSLSVSQGRRGLDRPACGL
jgi:hypothetical protein